ncbi:AimR family lysis-lysogeny pheromone receptor [uncultured Planococcus sp.]|uniref:AimR family lysis-lysogeny pheromone receptor n=1 Tax=uncultured Planococcus sp. TaxID=337815 RepID=UPI002627596F|nr:AimR family lysis-lysogeny pheromone receptor [uncultured Planococcus sp.]
MNVQTIIEQAMQTSATTTTYKDIAQHTGIDRTLISKFFAGKAELTLCDVLSVTRYVAPADEKEIVLLLVDDLIHAPKPANVKVALLYLVNNGMYEEMEELGQAIPKTHKANIAWYKLIEALALHKRGEVVGFNMVSSIFALNFDSPEFNALKTALFAQGSYTEGDFNHLFNFLADAELSATEIKSDFLRRSIRNYIAELMTNAYLFRKNDPKKCRFYANTIRGNCLTGPITLINNEYTTGVSYLFEDFDKALMHFNRSIEGWRRLGRHDRAVAIERDDIAFLHNYWRKELPQGSELADSARAHECFVQGDVEQAQTIALSLGMSAFDLFVKGLVFADDALLLMSAMEYRLKGNNFFAALPIKFIQAVGIKTAYTNSINSKTA